MSTFLHRCQIASSVCVQCSLNEESVQHLFLKCRVARIFIAPYGEVLQLSLTIATDNGNVVMSIGGDVAVTASTNNGTGWQPVSQLVSANASLELMSNSIKFRASLSDCNFALSTLEYRSTSSLSPNIKEIARITIIVNDMGNYGCYNDCSTATSVPLLAMSTIVIVNYGWSAHKWLLLRPEVLLGAATGIGMLLIFGASICAWLNLVNKLLTAHGKAHKIGQEHSILDALKARWNLFLSKFSKTEDFGPKEAQQISGDMPLNENLSVNYAIGTEDGDGEVQADGTHLPLLSAHGGDMPQDENSPIKCTIGTEDGNGEVQADDIHRSFVEGESLGDGEVQADETHQSFAEGESSGDGIAEIFPLYDYFEEVNEGSSALDATPEDVFHDMGPIPLSDETTRECLTGSNDENMHSMYALDPCGYVEGDFLANETSLETSGTMCAEVSGLASHSTHPGYSLDVENSIQWEKQGVAEDNSLAHDATQAVYAPDSGHFVNSLHLEGSYGPSSFMPTGVYCHSGSSFQGNVASEKALDHTRDNNGFDGYALPAGFERPDQQNLSTSFANTSGIASMDMVSPPTNVAHLYQHNTQDNEDCYEGDGGHMLETFKNKEDSQLADESQDPDDSMPFGDSSSSSHSYTSMEEGKNDDPEGATLLQPMMDMHGEVTPQMPELKVILELSEASIPDDEGMDPLDRVELVFSSFEAGPDGSLVAVLSQRR